MWAPCTIGALPLFGYKNSHIKYSSRHDTRFINNHEHTICSEMGCQIHLPSIIFALQLDQTKSVKLLKGLVKYKT